MNKIDKTTNLIWVSLLLIIYNFCTNLSNDIYLPSMPELVNVFSISTNLSQLTMTAWFAGDALPQLFFGPLTDRVGRRKVLLAGGICFLVATLFCVSATNIWLLIIARFFQGVGVCSLNVTTYGILIDLFDFKNRIKVMNRISMCGTLAPLIGPVIGGYVLVYLGWRFNFVVIFLLALISLLGLYFKLPESNLDLNPQALYLKNIAKNYYGLLKNKTCIQNLIPYCLILGGLIVYLTSAPFIIIGTLKISPEYFGYTQIPIFSAYVLGSLYLGFLQDENTIKNMLKLGIGIVFLGSIILALSSYFYGNNLWFFIGSMMIYGFGFSLCASPLVNEVMSKALLVRGSAAALLGFGMAVSCMFSSFLVGIVYDGSIFSAASLIIGIVLLAVSVYWLAGKGYQAVLEYKPE